MNGVIAAVGDHFEVRFERRFQRPIESVFAALTVPDRLAAWLAAVEIDPRPGGRLALTFNDPPYRMDGEVRLYEPPTLFEFTWPQPGAATPSIVRFELHPTDAGCRLILTQTFSSRGECPQAAAGWHEHLERFDIALDGISFTRWNRAREAELAAQYRALL